MEIDALARLFIGDIPDVLDLNETEIPDVLSKLISDGALAAALGGDRLAHARVERFNKETAQLDRDADILLKRERQSPSAGTPPARSDADLDVIDDDSRVLAKMEGPGDRRRRSLRYWISSQLALNKSVSELVEHAQKHDPQTARLIAEIGAELEAG